MIKFDGVTIRYGKLFELIDALAGDVGYRHVGVNKGAYVVTASVDGMHAFGDILADEDLRLQGFLTWVGKSSMEVHVNIITCQGRLAGSTQFIMVARAHQSGASFSVPSLDMGQDELRAGQARADHRKLQASQSLQLKPPRQEELGVLHKLYLEAQYLKQQKKAFLDSPISLASSSVSPLPFFKYMKHTVQRSVHLMHFQQRNIHGKIFGGHLMRVGFEIGYITAVCFFGSEAKTHFHCLDDIQFLRPANVGSTMEFEATATFSRAPFVVVEVVVSSIAIETGFKNKTNSMTFIFECNDTAVRVPDVMPRDYIEFVKFLEGRRSLSKMVSSSSSLP